MANEDGTTKTLTLDASNEGRQPVFVAIVTRRAAKDVAINRAKEALAKLQAEGAAIDAEAVSLLEEWGIEKLETGAGNYTESDYGGSSFDQAVCKDELHKLGVAAGIIDHAWGVAKTKKTNVCYRWHAAKPKEETDG